VSISIGMRHRPWGVLPRVVRYVYADVLFLVNLVANLGVLWVVRHYAGVPASAWRLLAAAAAGAVYAVGSLHPAGAFTRTWLGKVVFSLLMVAIAYSPRSWRQLFRLTGYVLCFSFLLAGAAACYWWLGGTSAAAPWWSLPLGAVGAVAVWHLSWTRQMRRDLAVHRCLRAEADISGHHVEFPALVDTGNLLRDPLTNSPVVVVDPSILKDLLPPDITPEDPLGSVRRISSGELKRRVRLIPYCSLGRGEGMLLGLRADRLLVHAPEGSAQHRGVVLALSPRPLCPDGAWAALLPPELASAEEVGEEWRRGD